MGMEEEDPALEEQQSPCAKGKSEDVHTQEMQFLLGLYLG